MSSKRFAYPEYLFLGIVAFVLIYQLFVPPITGLSNSGDYGRLMSWFGLDFPNNNESPTKFLYLNKTYDWNRTIEPHYPSSEVVMIASALAVNLVLSKDGTFDIRLLGAANALMLLLAFLLLTSYLRQFKVAPRLMLYALLLLIFTDVGYVAYFNSFYSEPASLIFLALTLASVLVIDSYGKESKHKKFSLLFFFAVSGLFVTAKVQNALMSFPLAYIGYRLYRLVFADQLSAKRFRTKAIVLPLVLVVFSSAYYVVSSKFEKRMRYQNIYKSVFHEILGHSKDPYGDAEALGLDSSYVFLAGTQPGAVEAPPEFKSYLINQIGYGKILKFYVTHPGRLFSLCDRCAAHGFTLRPTYLGNFEREYAISHGISPIQPIMNLPSKFKSQKFALWSSLKDRFLPKSIWLLIAFVIVNLAAIIYKAVRFDRTAKDRVITELHGAVLLMAIVQFLTSVMGEGDYDIVKHLFLFNALCEASCVFLVAYSYVMITRLKNRKKPQMFMETVS